MGISIRLPSSLRFPSGPTPSDLVADCILELDAARGITLNGSDVSAWADQSDELNDATQGTAADQPAFEATGGPNGYPCVTFDSSNTEFMDLPMTGATPQSFTVIAVVNTTNSGGIQTIYSPSYFAVSARQNGEQVGLFDGTSWAAGMEVVHGSHQILSWVFDSPATECSIYRDGSLLAKPSWDGTVTSPYATPRVGCLNSAAAHYMNGKVSYLLVWDRVLTAAELQVVHDWLMDRFAIAFDYDSVASLAGAFKSDEGVTGAAPITAWAEALAGGAMDVFTEGAGPAASTLGSRASQLYDGSNDYLSGDWALGTTNGLHDGTGSTLLVAFAPVLAGGGSLFSTAVGASTTTNGAELTVNTTGTVRMRIRNTSATALVDVTSGVILSADTLAVFAIRSETGATPEYELRHGGSVEHTTAFTGAANAGTEAGALHLGSRIGGAVQNLDVNMGDVVYYTRRLNDYETAAIEALATTRFS